MRKRIHRSDFINFKSITLVALFISLVFIIYQGNIYFNEQKVAASTIPTNSTAPVKHNFYEKLTTGSGGPRILVVGDSIGAGAGVKDKTETWFYNLEKTLENKYNALSFTDNISIGGATVFGGIFDYNNVKTNNTYDLVFICFGQNDQGAIPIPKFIELYEQLIRTIKEQKGNPEIYLIIESSLQDMVYSDAIKQIGSYYQFPVVDTVTAFKESGKPYESLTDDGIHPNKQGYELYHNEIAKLIDKNFSENKSVIYDAQPLITNYKNVTFRNISDFTNAQGFSKASNIYKSTTSGSYLETQFEGNLLGITATQSTDGGKIQVYVDNVLSKEFDVKGAKNRIKHYWVSDDYSEGSHTVRIVTKSNNSIVISGIITR